MQRSSARPGSDAGFSLIELLTAMLITSLLMGLAALPLRSYWFAQSLDGGADSMVTELRKLQEDAASESHPLVFGAKFTAGATTWTKVRYDPAAVAPTPQCTFQQREISSSAVFNASVIAQTVNITNPVSAEYTACGGGGKVLFFYARGTSTGGSIVLEEPITGKIRTLSISVLTGRVTRT